MAETTAYSWTVIGAGPAGIAAVGRLLDHGIAPAEIARIDPRFTAGDTGAKWQAVHGNTSVELFVNYLNASPSFRFAEHPISQPLKGATVAVQGSSHSAMIALPNLLASAVAKVISVGAYRRRIND